ncbi:ELO family, partial [Ochromonadaceae sp. CCMP2298]
MTTTSFLATMLSAPSDFAFQIEKDFDPTESAAFMRSHWHIPLSFLFAFVLLIALGPGVMAKREKAFDLQMPLAAWNAFLCIFSCIGMCKTVPYVLTMPFEHIVCSNPMDSWGPGVTGFWVCIFAFSKIPELIDTVFIVLRRKPLIFLHWYHHITVCLFCWSAYSTLDGSGLYFVAMNFSVHALMYGYYCLQALQLLPKSFPAVIITLAQIAQMFVGTGVCCACWYYSLTGVPCHNEKKNLIAGAIMYASYLYLFCEFAVKRFLRPKKVKK